jgi:uncharacterized membrane protein YoaK (UPF0700 family)
VWGWGTPAAACIRSESRLGPTGRKLCAAALAVVALSPHHIGTASPYAVIVLLAIAMRVQNTAARKLAVPDLTTTVLTMTLTGLAADAALAGHGSKLGRRALSVAAMLLGALIGGLLVLKVDNPAPLVLAVGVSGSSPEEGSAK